MRDGRQQISVVAGQTLQGGNQIGNLLVTARDGRPVYVRDLATIALETEPNETRVNHVVRQDNALHRVPAVSIAFAKRPGTKAVVIAEDILHRLEQVRTKIVPDGIKMVVTRNYGEAASELLFHLALATISIVLQVAVSIGLRAAIVVAIVIPTTILLMLFAAQFMGYMLKRVSPFALIFSIGILVDDAIVVIENIARHWAMKDGRPRVKAAIEAVA